MCVVLRHPPIEAMRRMVMRVSTIEMPRHGTEAVPIGVLSRYGQFIASGAFARLASMKNRMWTDEAQAAVEQKRFVEGIGSTRMRMLSGAQAGSGRVSAMNFSNVVV